MRTNEVYGEVAKIANGVSINFYYLRYFVLKFLFIEVIHSISLILVQYVPALLLMYYNTQKSKATHNT